MQFFQLFFSIGLPVLLIGLGYAVGSYRERRHLASLAEREAAGGDVVVNNLKRISNPETATSATLVIGSAVIASDYFKRFASSLRSFIGGELRSYRSLMSRARREALLRMIDQARQLGAAEVWNVRFGTMTVGAGLGRRGAPMAEVYAYGTAVVRSAGHEAA